MRLKSFKSQLKKNRWKILHFIKNKRFLSAGKDGSFCSYKFELNGEEMRGKE